VKRPQWQLTEAGRATRARTGHPAARGAVDLWPTDPGYPVDIYFATDIRTTISVWVGKRSLAAAIRSEHIEITGPREADPA